MEGTAFGSNMLNNNEQKKGVFAVDARTPSTLLAHQAGYFDRDNEVIVGLQTDQPFKPVIFSFGGLRMADAGPVWGGVYETGAAAARRPALFRRSERDPVLC